MRLYYLLTGVVAVTTINVLPVGAADLPGQVAVLPVIEFPPIGDHVPVLPTADELAVVPDTIIGPEDNSLIPDVLPIDVSPIVP